MKPLGARRIVVRAGSNARRIEPAVEPSCIDAVHQSLREDFRPYLERIGFVRLSNLLLLVDRNGLKPWHTGLRYDPRIENGGHI